MKYFAFIAMSLVVGFSVLVSASSSSSSQQLGLRIMTLNFNSETDNQTLRQKRLIEFEKYVAQQNVDVVFVQEGWSIGDVQNFATIVAQDLNMDLVYNFEDGVAGVRVTNLSLLAKKELNLRNVKIFKLPHSAVTVGDGQTTWVSAGETDMFIGGTVTLSDGFDAFVFTAHLNSSSSDYRVDQVKFAYAQMVSAVEESGATWENSRVFFGGDFNSTPESPEMTYLVNDAGFQDTWVLSQDTDPGFTFVNGVNDPQYDPMVHGSGEFPSQYSPQTEGRFDHLFAHVPEVLSAGVTRIFTSPAGGVWMSDHYGLLGNLILESDMPQNSPSADTDMASLGPPTTLTLTTDSVDSLPSQQDFDVTSPRGFTVVNNSKAKVYFLFTTLGDQVYGTDDALMGADDTASFAFFSSGDYNYRMFMFNDETDSNPLREMTGVIHVQ